MLPKTRLVLALSLVCFLLSQLQAQTLAPTSVHSAAVTFAQPSANLSFTVGDLIVLTHNGSDGTSLGNGFIAGVANSAIVLAIEEPKADLIEVSVYPNPTTDLVFVDILTSQLDYLYLDVVDVQGKQISSNKYAGITNQIGLNTVNWPTGIYFLIVKNEAKIQIGSYKIIKQ